MPSCIKYKSLADNNYVIEHVLLIWYMLYWMYLEDRLTIKMRHNPRDSFAAYEEYWSKFDKKYTHTL